MNKTLKWHIEGTIIPKPEEKIHISPLSPESNKNTSIANYIISLGIIFIVISILIRFIPILF